MIIVIESLVATETSGMDHRCFTNRKNSFILDSQCSLLIKMNPGFNFEDDLIEFARNNVKLVSDSN